MSDNVERPAPKFKIGQLVAVLASHRTHRIGSFDWSEQHCGWRYSSEDNCYLLNEFTLRSLTPEEIGVDLVGMVAQADARTETALREGVLISERHRKARELGVKLLEALTELDSFFDFGEPFEPNEPLVFENVTSINAALVKARDVMRKAEAAFVGGE
jgi:hypothetical protein